MWRRPGAEVYPLPFALFDKQGARTLSIPERRAVDIRLRRAVAASRRRATAQTMQGQFMDRKGCIRAQRYR